MKCEFIYENNNNNNDYDTMLGNNWWYKCKNYILCEAVLPNYWFDMKRHYLCGNCVSVFGT